MDKHKNADRHKIYPGFRKFYDKGLLKATYKDIALKKEYQCSKCGKKIKIDNYEKKRKRSRLIQWLIRWLVVGSVAMFRGDFHDAFAKIFLSYYEVQYFWFRFWEITFFVIVVAIPSIAAMTVVLWLERVIFLKRYCAKLQKSGTDPCPGEKTE